MPGFGVNVVMCFFFEICDCKQRTVIVNTLDNDLHCLSKYALHKINSTIAQ